ncbi:hypothetical protein ACROYT_G034945 [Oculina patagonica]
MTLTNAFLLHKQPDVSSSICKNKPQSSCRTYAGKRGVRGQNGGKGGNAGNPGNGGKAGRINIHSRKIVGRVQLNSCRGSGAQPAQNGRGGKGGAGGKGGKGRHCNWEVKIMFPPSHHHECNDKGPSGKASDGASGRNGAPGTSKMANH